MGDNMAELNRKNVLVTGACGTVGRELVRQLLEGDYGIASLVALDNNESELFFLEQRFMADVRASFYLADIRDRDKLARKMDGVDVVFHSAAFKHVILCERSPYEAVQTNIIGVQNVIAAATAAGAHRVIFTSSDKAVNPTSVMGTSKLMGERIMTAANYQSAGRTVFASTRFGNVLGSRGSVIPIFMRQIRDGGPVTLTDPEMTRFIMSVSQAVRLVIDSAGIARGGEVFITKMPVIRIADLAAVMIEELAPVFGHDPGRIEIRIIGVKPGEKLYEELMSDEETRRAIELPSYFVVLPAFRGIYRQVEYSYPGLCGDGVDRPYISAGEPAMSRKELREFLRKNDLLDTSQAGHPPQRYWPGEREEGGC